MAGAEQDWRPDGPPRLTEPQRPFRYASAAGARCRERPVVTVDPGVLRRRHSRHCWRTGATEMRTCCPTRRRFAATRWATSGRSTERQSRLSATLARWKKIAARRTSSSRHSSSADCATRRVVIDRTSLKGSGAHALYIGDLSIPTETIAQRRAKCPRAGSPVQPSAQQKRGQGASSSGE